MSCRSTSHGDCSEIFLIRSALREVQDGAASWSKGAGGSEMPPATTNKLNSRIIALRLPLTAQQIAFMQPKATSSAKELSLNWSHLLMHKLSDQEPNWEF